MVLSGKVTLLVGLWIVSGTLAGKLDKISNVLKTSTVLRGGGYCGIEDDNNEYYSLLFTTNQFLSDITSSAMIPRSTYFNLRSVSSASVLPNKYFSITNPTNEIDFRLKRALDEASEISRSTNNYYYNFTIQLNCSTGGSNLVNIRVPVIDTNNHVPTFEQNQYSISFCPASDDFQSALNKQKIIVTDIDVTNTEVIFDIQNNPYVDVFYGGIIPGSLNKKHYAILRAKSGLNLTTDISLKITATDVGYPPLKSSTTLILRTGQLASAPRFTKPAYIIAYSLDHQLNVTNGPIEVENILNSAPLNFTLKGNYSSNFALTTNSSENRVDVELMYPLEDIVIYKYKFIVLEIEARYEQEPDSDYGSTVAIVDLRGTIVNKNSRNYV